MQIFIHPKVYKYVQDHQLELLLRKAVYKLKTGNNAGLDFKKREPKSKDIWSFRLTRKYRAYCRKQGSKLIIYEIDDHQ